MRAQEGFSDASGHRRHEVVNRGHGDGIDLHINTSGVGTIPEGVVARSSANSRATKC